MGEMHNRKEIYEALHLVILISFTAFSAIHVLEIFLLDWDKWPIFIIVCGVAVSWWLHIRNTVSDYMRMWFYASMMMCTFFIYAIHDTSTFDLAVVMSASIMLFTITSIKGLITLCQITYYISMVYDVIKLYRNGVEFDTLVISRILLHFAMITMLAWFAKNIIDKWSMLLEKSEDEITELTESTDRLNDFLANVSHELRTPVNAVIGLSGICIDKEQSEDIKSDLVSIRSAGRKVAEQIGDILDYSEIDRGRIVKNSEDYMVSSMVNDIVNDVREYMKDEVELVLDIAPSIPAVMNSDVSKIKKILKALITNGLKYTREGGVYVKIDSEKHEYGVNLRIVVSDTGIGMTEEELSKIYERYYQSDSSRTRSSGGLGLGLGIVLGFVSLLGGFVTISSRVDEGTTVRVSIPQRVIDDKNCMSFEEPDKLTIGSFLHFDKFSSPKVREYYNNALVTMMRGLQVQMHRVDTVENLKNLVGAVNLTHLFVGQEEYLENRSYIESLTDEILVVVVANPGFKLPSVSKAKVLEKPFYGIPVVTMLKTSVGKRDVTFKRMRLEGVKALVVDDEPMNLIVAKSIFGRYGMKVVTAASGQESIDISRAEEFDIIFMDHMMGGMDGVEAMKRIRADVSGHGQNIPIIALTANAMSSAKQMFMAEGFDGFVSKPIELEELERVIRKVLPNSMITYVDDTEDSGHSDADSDDTQSDAGSDADSDADQVDTSAVSNQTDAGASTDKESSDIACGLSYVDMLKQLNIDTDTGLGYCAGDDEFYKVILEQFASEVDEKTRDMYKYIANKVFKQYEIIIHAVKSTSKMIGVMDLSDAALKLEKAASGGDAEYILAHHQDTMKRYNEVCDGIYAALGKKRPAAVGDDEVMEFGAGDDEVMEFGAGDNEVMEFGAEDDEVMEFGAGDDEVMEFGPDNNEEPGNDEVMEFSPVTEES